MMFTLQPSSREKCRAFDDTALPHSVFKQSLTVRRVADDHAARTRFTELLNGFNAPIEHDPRFFACFCRVQSNAGLYPFRRYPLCHGEHCPSPAPAPQRMRCSAKMPVLSRKLPINSRRDIVCDHCGFNRHCARTAHRVYERTCLPVTRKHHYCCTERFRYRCRHIVCSVSPSGQSRAAAIKSNGDFIAQNPDFDYYASAVFRQNFKSVFTRKRIHNRFFRNALTVGNRKSLLLQICRSHG